MSCNTDSKDTISDMEKLHKNNKVSNEHEFFTMGQLSYVKILDSTKAALDGTRAALDSTGVALNSIRAALDSTRATLDDIRTVLNSSETALKVSNEHNRFV
jgi:hypothetical protein